MDELEGRNWTGSLYMEEKDGQEAGWGCKLIGE